VPVSVQDTGCDAEVEALPMTLVPGLAVILEEYTLQETPTILPPELLQPNTNTNLNLGETSSACPSKMGEGSDGSSHCPLPKVVVRSEEESLKLNINQLEED